MPNGSANEHDVWSAINDIRRSVSEISSNTATLVRADADREKICAWHAKDIKDLQRITQENKMKIAKGLNAQAFITTLITAAVVLVPTLVILLKHMSSLAAEVAKLGGH